MSAKEVISVTLIGCVEKLVLKNFQNLCVWDCTFSKHGKLKTKYLRPSDEAP